MNLKRGKLIGLFVVLVLCGGGIFLYNNTFNADSISNFSISGNVYAEDSKALLPDVDIQIYSSANKPAVSTKTDALGKYTITVPDPSYRSIIIKKPNYRILDGVITNSGNLPQVALNLVLKPGIGGENIQIVTAKKSGIISNPAPFGLSLEPFDSSPASLTQVVPVGSSYKLTPLSGQLSNDKGVPFSPIQFKISDAGQLPVQLVNPSAVYSSDTDSYFVIGSQNPADDTQSIKIYEYNRTDKTAEAMTTLPTHLAGSKISSVYLPEKKLIMIVVTPAVGNGQMYFYEPATNLLSSVNQTEANVTKLIRLSDSVLLIAEDLNTNKTSFIETVKIADIGNTQIQTGKITTTKTNITPVNLSGTIPYYSAVHNKIFLFGGKDSVSVKNTIFELSATKIAGQTSAPVSFTNYTRTKLISPVHSSKLIKLNNGSESRLILIGGYDSSNKLVQNGYQSLDEPSGGYGRTNNLTNSSSSSINISYSLEKFALVQDNSNRAFLIGTSSSTDSINKYIQDLSPLVSLVNGKKYELTTWQDTAIVFRGRAKQATDSFEFLANQGEVIDFVNPYLRAIKLKDLKIQYQDQHYTLSEAINRNDPLVAVNNSRYQNQPSVNTNNPDQSIESGQIIPIDVLKPGAKFYMSIAESLDACLSSMNDNDPILPQFCENVHVSNFQELEDYAKIAVKNMNDNMVPDMADIKERAEKIRNDDIPIKCREGALNEAEYNECKARVATTANAATSYAFQVAKDFGVKHAKKAANWIAPGVPFKEELNTSYTAFVSSLTADSGSGGGGTGGSAGGGFTQSISAKLKDADQVIGTLNLTLSKQVKKYSLNISSSTCCSIKKGAGATIESTYTASVEVNLGQAKYSFRVDDSGVAFSGASMSF